MLEKRHNEVLGMDIYKAQLHSSAIRFLIKVLETRLFNMGERNDIVTYWTSLDEDHAGIVTINKFTGSVRLVMCNGTIVNWINELLCSLSYDPVNDKVLDPSDDDDNDAEI